MFYISRMGCDCRHDSNFIIDKPDGFEGYLALFIKTRAVFMINGSQVSAEPDTFIIFDRKAPQYYKADGAEYINDWILFDCTESLDTVSDILFNTPVYIGESADISQYFRMIADCYYRMDLSRTAEFLIKAMLSEVFSGNDSRQGTAATAHYRELLELRRRIYASPSEDWSIEKMSKYINVSGPYLHLIYKKAFGVSCTADVINSRIEQAKHLLLCTDMTVEETAFACGYKNIVHFTRQFKQISGSAPSKWRRDRSE